MTRQAIEELDTNMPQPAASMPRTTRKAQSRPGETCVYHNGIRYTKGWDSMVKITFRCSVYRSAQCNALLHVYATGGCKVTGKHTCLPTQDPEADTIDVPKQMKQMVDTLAIMDLAVPYYQIWDAVNKKFYPQDDVIRKGLSDDQVKNRVYRMRRKHYGSHLLGLIEVPPLSMVVGKPLSFFQFHQSRPSNDPTAKAQRIIGWAHPEIRHLLMYHNVSIFFDGTFRSAPKGFKQCVIMMVHDRSSELYVPVYYVLCTGKERDMYFGIVEQIYRNTSEILHRVKLCATLSMH